MNNVLVTFLAGLLLISTKGFSGSYDSDIKSAMQECKVDRSSLLYKDAWNEPPSCVRVKDLIDLQRLETEADTSVQTGQQMPTHIDTDRRN